MSGAECAEQSTLVTESCTAGRWVLKRMLVLLVAFIAACRRTRAEERCLLSSATLRSEFEETYSSTRSCALPDTLHPNPAILTMRLARAGCLALLLVFCSVVKALDQAAQASQQLPRTAKSMRQGWGQPGYQQRRCQQVPVAPLLPLPLRYGATLDCCRSNSPSCLSVHACRWVTPCSRSPLRAM